MRVKCRNGRIGEWYLEVCEYLQVSTIVVEDRCNVVPAVLLILVEGGKRNSLRKDNVWVRQPSG